MDTTSFVIRYLLSVWTRILRFVWSFEWYYKFEYGNSRMEILIRRGFIECFIKEPNRAITTTVWKRL